MSENRLVVAWIIVVELAREKDHKWASGNFGCKGYAHYLDYGDSLNI